MTDLIALLFGAVIIVIFSYERFNRSTDEAGRQLERLVTLLSPDNLRSSRVFFRAYGFYVAMFLLVYLFLCAYAELIPALGGPSLPVGASKIPGLPSNTTLTSATGFSSQATEYDAADIIWNEALSPADNLAAKSAFSIGINAATSLAVALMIVGLAPAFPILQKFEAWMRGSAHRLAGIPTRILSVRDELRSNLFGVSLTSDHKIPTDTLLIPSGDWQRMVHYREHAGRELDSPEEFENNFALIIAVSAWILDRKLKLSNQTQLIRFAPLEKELRERTALLIATLDEMTGYPPSAPCFPAPQEVSGA